MKSYGQLRLQDAYRKPKRIIKREIVYYKPYGL